MKREIITIDEYGILTIPSNPAETVWMNDCELVELFGMNFSTLRTHPEIERSSCRLPAWSDTIRKPSAARLLRTGDDNGIGVSCSFI